MASVLQLREAQMEVLREAALKVYARQLAVDLRARLPHRCAPHAEPALVELILAALSRATAYGIVDADEVIPYVELVVSHGLGFEEREELAWTAALLESDSLSGSVKVALLLDRMPARHRPEAL